MNFHNMKGLMKFVIFRNMKDLLFRNMKNLKMQCKKL